MRSQSRLAALLALAASAALAACGTDPVAPAAVRPSLLVAPGESMVLHVDSTDAAGNVIMVAEYGAGTYYLPDGTGASVASVTIRTFIPAYATAPVASSGGPCITSTVQAVETTAGWRYGIKKPGGCDRDVVVELENRSTRQKATFTFSMIFGRTRIDHGLVR